MKFDAALLGLRPTGKVDILTSVKGRVVGAVQDTTNAKSAQYLARKYGFSVETKYKSSTEAILALDRGEVEYVMVDEPFLSDFELANKYSAHKEGLKKELESFYKQEYGGGRNGEELAVAVNVHGDGQKILQAINSLIDSNDGQFFLKTETDCWIKRGKFACEQEMMTK